MKWAVSKGIINGYSDDTFRPTRAVTRQQMALMLFRQSGEKAPEGATLDAFTDASTITAGAVDAFRWATAKGVMNGSNGRLNPGATLTRIQGAAMLARYLGAK